LKAVQIPPLCNQHFDWRYPGYVASSAQSRLDGPLLLSARIKVRDFGIYA